MSGDFLSPHSKDRKKLNKLAKFYGVDGFDYQGQDEGETGFGPKGRPGSHNGAKGRVENRTTEDVARDINTAMANGAMGDYLRYSGKSLPNVMNDDGEVNSEGLFDLHKDAKKAHKEIGGNNYNNAGSDNFKLANHAFSEWESNLKNSLAKDDDESPTEEETAPTRMSWNEAKESGTLSPSVQAALDRLNNNDYAINLKKATDNTPTNTPASQAQQFLKDSVTNIASDKSAIAKSKQKENAYGGILGGAGAISLISPML